MIKRLSIFLFCLILPATVVGEEQRGRVTSLLIPRFVSMKATEGYARRGPSQSQRIDWVFKHQGQPLMVLDEYEHWRRVQDAEGQGGWMHFRLLTGVRTVSVTAEKTTMYRRARRDSAPAAILEQGVIAKLITCKPQFCRVQIGSKRGWVTRADIWGVLDDEIFE